MTSRTLLFSIAMLLTFTLGADVASGQGTATGTSVGPVLPELLILSGKTLTSQSELTTLDTPQDTQPTSPSATPSSESVEGQGFRNEYLFGDWGGARTWLASHGIKPTAFIISDPFGSLTGGQQQGATD
jgi:hypothetical protein